MRLPAVLALSTTMTALLACQSVTSPEAYDRSCERNSQCTLMPFGDQCADCAQAFDAVNIDAVDAVLDDASGAGQSCPFWTAFDANRCPAPAISAPVCVDNRCEANDGGDDCAAAGRGICQGVD